MKLLPNNPLSVIKSVAVFAAVACGLGSRAAGAPDDWPSLEHYREDNAKVLALPPDRHRVVFLGDSITEFWNQVGKMFQDTPFINRGISGQTTPQILLRFRQDVIALKPEVVAILAGTNDIAGNTGPSTPEMIEDNLASMVDLAHANGIRVVLCSILPAYEYPWRPGIAPAEEIVAINTWMKNYAAAHDCIYLDYFSAMADSRNGMKADYSKDGVHPNAAGYAVMEPLAEKAVSQARALR